MRYALVLQWFQDYKRNACLLTLVLEHSNYLIYTSFICIISIAIFEYFCRLKIAKIKDARILQWERYFCSSRSPAQKLAVSCSQMARLWSMQSCAVRCPELRIRNGTAARAVSMPLGPPDGFQVANTRPQDESKRPPSEMSESCTFLARSGGLPEDVPNRKWLVLHWFYNVF